MTTVSETTDKSQQGHERRAEFITDLRDFADLLERRPDMPIGAYDTVRVQYSVTEYFGNESARVAEVERVAAILGVDVQRDERVARAELDMGRVTYVVHAITDYGIAVYDAERSYAGAVEPNLVGV